MKKYCLFSFKLDAYKYHLTKQQIAELDSAFIRQRFLMETNGPEAREKVQLVRGANNKQFAVGIVGYANTVDNFMIADKSNVNSIKSLAKLMDRVHR